MGNRIEQLHQEVSLEFRNPFAVVGNFALGKLSAYMRDTNKEAVNFITKITDDHLPTDFSLTDYRNKFENTYGYSDVAKLHVFVPAVLKPNAYMLEYVEGMLAASQVALDIIEFGGSEILDTLNRFIGLPRQLRDLSGNENYSEATSKILDRVEELRVRFEKITSATGTQTERPYGKAYRRNLDYFTVIEKTQRIQENLNIILKRLGNYKKLMNDVEKASKQLISLIESKPEEYALGNVAATRISNTMYAFAREAEFLGATIHNSRVVIKCVVDTSLALKQAQDRFAK